MHVFHQLDEVGPALGSPILPSAVAIGNFDGCHLGHVELLRQMLADARAADLSPTVLTFFPHPVEVLNPTKPLKRISTTSEKLARFEALGVDRVFVVPFDRALSQMTAEDFFRKYLLEGLHAKSIHVGFNFSFGKDRKGNTDLLAGLCQTHALHLNVMKPFELSGARVSSSVIRDLLHRGEVKKSAQFLGRNYAVTGLVSRGDSRGRGLGFPTANLNIPLDKVLPCNGVYVTRALWQKQWYASVTNVGVRPTFDAPSVQRPVIEVHFLDFHAKIYDETVQLEFMERVREEKKFDSVEQLKTQIADDILYARKFFQMQS